MSFGSVLVSIGAYRAILLGSPQFDGKKMDLDRESGSAGKKTRVKNRLYA
jgi:hypothetical protein